MASASMAQASTCSAHCSIPGRLNLNHRALPRSTALHCCKTFRKSRLISVRASAQAEDCNEEECAPEKEVGKVSMEWVAEEKTKVVGTFPPLTKRWTGYVEKDTAGQTNIYSVEPTVYVSESAISSGEAGTSSEGSEQTATVAISLGLVMLGAVSLVLSEVGNDPPKAESTEYSGPPLSYYIKKFNKPLVIETIAPVEIQNAPAPVSSAAIEENGQVFQGESDTSTGTKLEAAVSANS